MTNGAAQVIHETIYDAGGTLKMKQQVMEFAVWVLKHSSAEKLAPVGQHMLQVRLLHRLAIFLLNCVSAFWLGELVCVLKLHGVFNGFIIAVEPPGLLPTPSQLPEFVYLDRMDSGQHSKFLVFEMLA